MKTFPAPVAGIDYPRNLQEFDRVFADEAACRSYLFRVRWPEGYQCFRCRNKTPPWITSRGYLHCRECGGEISITSGTVFERTRKPLRVWFQAMWLVTSQKHGASALGLSASTRPGQLPDGLDLAAQVAARNGPTGPRAASRFGRGG